MLTEGICLDILNLLYGRRTTMTQTYFPDEPEKRLVNESSEEHALADNELYRKLLPRFDLREIDTAVRWLQLGEFISRTEWGLRGPWVHALTDKGLEAVQAGQFQEEDLRLLYRVDPYTVFIAHQFIPDDEEIVGYIRERLLERNGLAVYEGKADGLEEFRHSILKKIRESRYFLCLMTKRAALDSGLFVSSVWLYQEIGAAIAFGKSPLLLVEDGIDQVSLASFKRALNTCNLHAVTTRGFLKES